MEVNDKVQAEIKAVLKKHGLSGGLVNVELPDNEPSESPDYSDFYSEADHITVRNKLIKFQSSIEVTYALLDLGVMVDSLGLKLNDSKGILGQLKENPVLFAQVEEVCQMCLPQLILANIPASRFALKLEIFKACLEAMST